MTSLVTPVHLIKLCVGASSIEDLADWQAHCLREAHARGRPGELLHVTRQTPRRAGVGPGSSLYWVIKGFVMVRQNLIALRELEGPDGITRCAFVLAPALIPTELQPRRPFQGWRYLDEADAPRDLSAAAQGDAANMPTGMRRQLAEMALL
jgi:hypothetical protein